jgi:hypothetical protein
VIAPGDDVIPVVDATPEDDVFPPGDEVIRVEDATPVNDVIVCNPACGVVVVNCPIIPVDALIFGALLLGSSFAIENEC